MSLGLFAAAVVLLEQHGAMSVDRLANLLAVSPGDALAMLHDIRAQGHCVLTHDVDGGVLRATWVAQPSREAA